MTAPADPAAVVGVDIDAGDQVPAELRTDGTNTGAWRAAIGGAPPNSTALRVPLTGEN